MRQPIDLQKEVAITLREALELLPRRHGKKIHYATIHRWATKGTRGRVLETWRLGGLIFTSAAALNRFANGGAATARDPFADAGAARSQDHSEDGYGVASMEPEQADALREALYGKPS